MLPVPSSPPAARAHFPCIFFLFIFLVPDERRLDKPYYLHGFSWLFKRPSAEGHMQQVAVTGVPAINKHLKKPPPLLPGFPGLFLIRRLSPGKQELCALPYFGGFLTRD
jgi:hypothetical protein